MTCQYQFYCVRPKSGFIAIHTFRNITNKSFAPVKAFDPGLKLLEKEILVPKTTVLCKSNASEMREFCYLFTHTFQESLSDNSRPFERNFPGTKNDILSNFRYKTKFQDDKCRFTNSVPEISRWTDTTTPHTIYSIYPSYNVCKRYTEGFQRTPKLEVSHEQRE